jgi:hypothetical protein
MVLNPRFETDGRRESDKTLITRIPMKAPRTPTEKDFEKGERALRTRESPVLKMLMTTQKKRLNPTRPTSPRMTRY